MNVSDTGPQPMPRPTPAPLPAGTTCVSKMAYLPDSFCVSIACDSAYSKYCATNVATMSTVPVAEACAYYAVGVNETIADVAIALDENVTDIITRNVDPKVGLLATTTTEVTLGDILLIPGTCPLIDTWAPTMAPQNSDTWAPTKAPGSSGAATTQVAASALFALLFWIVRA